MFGEEGLLEGCHYLTRIHRRNAYVTRVSMLFQLFLRISRAHQEPTLYNFEQRSRVIGFMRDVAHLMPGD
jgi:hypothetical protein